MSEQKQNEQDAATPAELADTNLEDVAGGVTGNCIPEFPGCILFPPETTTY